MAHLGGASAERVAVPLSLRRAWRHPPTWLVTQLHAFQSPVGPEDAWRTWRSAVVVAVVLGLVVGGPLLALIGGGLAAGAPVVIAAVARSRAEAAYDSNLAAFLDAVARGARSGGSLPNAIDEASRSARGAVAVDAQRVAMSVTRGRPLGVALDEWARQRPSASVRLAASALALAVDTGGPPARVIEEVAAALRQRQQVDAEARALAAQARLSAMVVGIAPIGFAALTSLTDRRNAEMMFGTPIGVACVTVGLGLDALRRLLDAPDQRDRVTVTVFALAIGWSVVVVTGFGRLRPASVARAVDLQPSRSDARHLRLPASVRSFAPAASRRTIVVVAMMLVPAASVFPPAAVVIVVVTAVRPVLHQRRKQRDLVAAIERDVGDVVALLGLAVGAGHNLVGALRVSAERGVGPVSTALRGTVMRVERGERLADVLDALPGDLGDEVRPLTAALVSCDRYGAPLTSTLERLGADVRIASRHRAEAAARRLPIRLLFPLITCILPAFALLTVAPLIAGSFQGLRL